MQRHSLRFGWFAKSFDPRKASIRLRLLAPMAALRGRGIDIEPFRRAGARDYDAIIFSKSFTRTAVRTARAAEAAGQAVIVDICDNMFDQAQRAGRSAKRARIVEQLRRATLITVATPALGAQLVRHLPDVGTKLRVVPDMLEDLTAAGGACSALDRWRLARLRRFVGRHRGALHCVWFGKSSGDAAGLAHLDAAAGALERFAARAPITLTVIGDERRAVAQAARGWALPHHYMPWSLASFGAALRMHRVAVIPVGRNDYTAGKTINRPATAILAGLGVVADAIDSYEELRPFIALDDWQSGLARYAEGWDEEQPRIEAARALLHRRYGPDAVADRWQAVLGETAGSN